MKCLRSSIRANHSGSFHAVWTPNQLAQEIVARPRIDLGLCITNNIHLYDKTQIGRTVLDSAVVCYIVEEFVVVLNRAAHDAVHFLNRDGPVRSSHAQSVQNLRLHPLNIVNLAIVGII